MPAGEARTEDAARWLTGRLLRAHQRFSLAALAALHPELAAQDLARALADEQHRDRVYVDRMRARVADRARWALDRDGEGLDERLRGIARTERGHLERHIAATGRRLALEAKLEQLRLAGQTVGVWVPSGSDRPCGRCWYMGGEGRGLAWPLETLAALGPQTSHHGCLCGLASVTEARAMGLSTRLGRAPRPEPDPPAGRPERTALREAATAPAVETDPLLEAAIARTVAGLPAGTAERMAARLREATVPRWREAEHPRGRTTPRTNRGSFRPRASVEIGDVHATLRPGLERLGRAAERGDLDGIEAGFEAMTDRARRLRDPQARNRALQAAYRARAAALDPGGPPTPMGGRVAYGGERAPVPIGIPQPGAYGPWSARGTFLWELGPGELGASHERAMRVLRESPALSVTDRPDGGALVESGPATDRPAVNLAARRLEILLPQLRAMRAEQPGRDLGDTSPIDLHPDEPGALSSGARGPFDLDPLADDARSSAYPRVSTDRLGDAGESLVDAVAVRMRELELLGPNDDVDFTNADRRGSPLDWRLGAYGVEVKTQSMRSLVPGVAQRSAAIDATQRAEKVAAAEMDGLEPALVTVLADLDVDRAYVFFHAYAPGERAFTGVRPPVALVDRLMDGSLRPGEFDTGMMGPRGGREENRHVFVGAFRLGYNPLTAPNAEPADRAAARRRAAPADVGASGPVPDPSPERRPTWKQQRERRADENRAERAGRDEEIATLIRQGVSQRTIAKRFGLTQPRIAQIVKQLRDDGTLPAKPSRQPGLDVPAGRGTSRGARRREALAHRDAGLDVRRIARKMELTQAEVDDLLADDAAQPVDTTAARRRRSQRKPKGRK